MIYFWIAVSVNDTSLFILFGLDKNGNPTNNLLILDVKDLDSISFTSTFPIISNSTSSNNGTNSTNKSDEASSDGLSTEAAVGIAVGCGAVVILSYLSLDHLITEKTINLGYSCHYCTHLFLQKKQEDYKRILQNQWKWKWESHAGCRLGQNRQTTLQRSWTSSWICIA